MPDPLVWEYQTSKGWKEYSASISRQLQKSYDDGAAFCVVERDSDFWVIEFSDMEQCSSKDQHTRKVRCTPRQDTAPAAPAPAPFDKSSLASVAGLDAVDQNPPDGVRWECQADDGRFVPYGREITALLENAFMHKRPKTQLPGEAGGGTYYVETLEEVTWRCNQDTRRKRRVRRVNGQPPDLGLLWQWLDEDGQWRTYDAATLALVQRAHANRLLYVDFEKTGTVVGGQAADVARYRLTFKTKMQENTSTGSRRPVRKTTSRALAQAQAAQRWEWEGACGSWHRFSGKANDALNLMYTMQQGTGTFRLKLEELGVAQLVADFGAMEMASDGGACHRIRRVPASSPYQARGEEGPAVPPDTMWMCQDGEGGYMSLTPEQSAELELLFQAGEKRADLSNGIHAVDFEKMTRTNRTNRQFRRLKRVAAEPPPPATAAAANRGAR
uniref:WWE domain-containing protein n=1 Tax=Eutreptiella gymnastica TaxID=73025 RepID=A0A7S1J7W2_9EUGL